MKFIPTTPADVEKIKARAKVLKRRHAIKHREALEKAARECGYLHWHHVSLCQKESHNSALQLTMSFLCSSMQKDALKGETHYIAESLPFPFVILANGKQDCALLNIETNNVLVLAYQGQAREYHVEDGPPLTIRWHGHFVLRESALEITEAPGDQVLRIDIDEEAMRPAIERAESCDAEDDDGLIHIHDLDEPPSAELFKIVTLGAGLVPITPEIAHSLVLSGYEQKAVDDAVAAGARYSPARNSIFYPPEALL